MYHLHRIHLLHPQQNIEQVSSARDLVQGTQDARNARHYELTVAADLIKRDREKNKDVPDHILWLRDRHYGDYLSTVVVQDKYVEHYLPAPPTIENDMEADYYLQSAFIVKLGGAEWPDFQSDECKAVWKEIIRQFHLDFPVNIDDATQRGALRFQTDDPVRYKRVMEQHCNAVRKIVGNSVLPRFQLDTSKLYARFRSTPIDYKLDSVAVGDVPPKLPYEQPVICAIDETIRECDEQVMYVGESMGNDFLVPDNIYQLTKVMQGESRLIGLINADGRNSWVPVEFLRTTPELAPPIVARREKPKFMIGEVVRFIDDTVYMFGLIHGNKYSVGHIESGPAVGFTDEQYAYGLLSADQEKTTYVKAISIERPLARLVQPAKTEDRAGPGDLVRYIASVNLLEKGVFQGSVYQVVKDDPAYAGNLIILGEKGEVSVSRYDLLIIRKFSDRIDFVPGQHVRYCGKPSKILGLATGEVYELASIHDVNRVWLRTPQRESGEFGNETCVYMHQIHPFDNETKNPFAPFYAGLKVRALEGAVKRGAVKGKVYLVKRCERMHTGYSVWIEADDGREICLHPNELGIVDRDLKKV